jgi:hypothetical protein
MSSAIPVTLWRSFSRGRCSAYTWREFVDTFIRDPEVVRDKRRVAGFSLGKFTENRRALHRVEHVHALTLDFDGGDTTIAQAARLLPGVMGVAYTTFSHTIDWPKLRVIYPLSRPVDSFEYESLWLWAAEKIAKLGHILDESARDASRFWYLPSHEPGGSYEWRELEGRLLDVAEILAGCTHTRSFPGWGQALARTSDAPRKERECVSIDSADDSFFGRAFTLAGMSFDLMESGALPVVCPWVDAHTSGTDGDTSTVILPPTTDAKWGLFHCSHAHCVKRKTIDLLDVLPPEALRAARVEHGAGIVRTQVRAGFVQRLEACDELAMLERFVLRCYPMSGGAPLIWTVKINSRAHVEGLDALPLGALRRRKIDLATRGREITWGRLAPGDGVAVGT